LHPKADEPKQGGIIVDDVASFFSPLESGSASSSDEIPYQSDEELCYAYNDGENCKSCGGKREKGRFEDACPKCRMEIPRMRGDFSGRSFTVSGPSGAGKTHYLVAINEWARSHLGHYHLSMSPAMADRLRRGFDVLRNRVLKNKETVMNTPAQQNISFSWRISKANPNGTSMLLTLPDASGERLLNYHHLLANRYYHHTCGIILLIDAGRFTDSGDGRDPEDHVKLVHAMIEFLAEHLTPEEMKRLPIAVCVNKSDLLTDDAGGEWAKIAEEPDYMPVHQNGFDHDVCNARSEAIRGLLWHNPNMPEVITSLEQEFEHLMYFLIATIGSADEKELQFMPNSVEDPFLYLLWESSFVDLKR
jgi:hypothetical protein